MSGNAGSAGRAAPWPDRGRFIACVVGGTLSVLALDCLFAPALFAQASRVESSASAREASPGESSPRTAAAAGASVVARFEHDSHEPVDDTAVRLLATAMGSEHDTRIALAGSIDRAKWVKARLVSLGVSGERIEVVGGASATSDASALDEVEARWREAAQANEAKE